jgi:hypothetical protein
MASTLSDLGVDLVRPVERLADGPVRPFRCNPSDDENCDGADHVHTVLRDDRHDLVGRFLYRHFHVISPLFALGLTVLFAVGPTV